MTDLSNINKLFELQLKDNISEKILEVLKEIVPFEYACICYTEPEKVVADFGPEKNYKNSISADLTYKNTRFGKIVIHKNKEFSKSETDIFKTSSYIISNMIKDSEITKIMKLQIEALQNGYKELKNAENVKSNFISHVSHELRTPLNSIIGISDILENEMYGELNSKQKEYITDIKASGITLLNMINEVLDMTKLESNSVSVNPKTFNVSDLVFELENIVKPLCLQKNIQFIKEVESFSINADYMKVFQILLNLISNSVKFTPNSGEIILRIYKQSKFSVFEVEDNGIGIDKKYQKKIFEKFMQVNENIPNSTGLGLAIVKEFTELHNGTVELFSEPENFTKFVVKLPLCFYKNML